MRKQLWMIALAATMLAMPAWAQQAVEQQVMDLANRTARSKAWRLLSGIRHWPRRPPTTRN